MIKLAPEQLLIAVPRNVENPNLGFVKTLGIITNFHAELGVREVSDPNQATTEPQEAITEADLESANRPDYGLFFDLRKTIDWYQALKKEKGPQAQAIAKRVLVEDLYTQAWEMVDTKEPCTFEYRLVKVGDEIRMVHASDEHNSKNILDGVDKRVRRGLEYQQLASLRAAVIKAAEGSSLFVISPKLDRQKENGQDCYYPDTFLTIFYKDQDGRIIARQFKSKFLDTEKSAELVNKIPGGNSPIRDKSDLDAMIVTVGKAQGWIKSEDVNAQIEQITGIKLKASADILKIRKLSEIAGEVMIQALDRRLPLSELEELHLKMLLFVVDGQPSERVKKRSDGTIYIDTGCTFISGRGRSNSLNSLMSKESGSEVECPRCKAINTCQTWGEECYSCHNVMKKPSS